MTSRHLFSTSSRRIFATGLFAGFSVAATNHFVNNNNNRHNNSESSWWFSWNNNKNDTQQQLQDDTSSTTAGLFAHYLPFFYTPSSKSRIIDNIFSAQCADKAPDTPDYLIPYYLRDTKSRFVHYATIKDGKVRKMKPEDFLAAMLAIPDGAVPEDLKVVVSPATSDDDKTTEGVASSSSIKKFASFFKWADADGDGTINFREFAFLANILAYPLRDFKVLFNLFDNQSKGGLSRDEFSAMLISVSDEKMAPKLRSGIVRAMFLPEDHKKFCSATEVLKGPTVRAAKNQKKSGGSQESDPAAAPTRMIADKVPADAVVTFERFSAVVRQIETMIAETEFNLYDKGSKGFVSNEEFGNMVTRSIHGRHLPFFIVDNLRKMGKNTESSSQQIYLTTYLLFSEIIGRAEDVSQALQLYAAAGFAIKANDLKRALDRVVKLSRPITIDEAQLLTNMFDANSDGELHIEEFVSILRAKASYCGVLPKERNKDDLFTRFGKCSSDAMKQVRNGGVLPDEDDE